MARRQKQLKPEWPDNDYIRHITDKWKDRNAYKKYRDLKNVEYRQMLDAINAGLIRMFIHCKQLSWVPPLYPALRLRKRRITFAMERNRMNLVSFARTGRETKNCRRGVDHESNLTID